MGGGAQGRELLLRCASVGPFFSDFPCLLIQLPDSDKNRSTRKSSHLVKTWYFKSYLDELMSGMEGCCWLSIRADRHWYLLPTPSSYLPPQKIPLAGTFHRRRSPLLKTGFFRQVMELKIQKEKSTHCFMSLNNPQNSEMKFCEKCEVDMLKSHLNYHSLQP